MPSDFDIFLPSTSRKRTCIQWRAKCYAGGAFGLRDLVLVVREHQVFAAGVEVEAVAEELHGHGGALDVPAGAAGAERGLPAVFAGLGRLPESEVAGGVLLVLIHIDARAVFNAFKIFFGELAVVGIAGDAEVPGAVFGLVGEVRVRRASG